MRTWLSPGAILFLKFSKKCYIYAGYLSWNTLFTELNSFKFVDNLSLTKVYQFFDNLWKCSVRGVLCQQSLRWCTALNI